MNTESIKRLTEADKKANEVIQKARKEKEILKQESIQKSIEHEQRLVEAKVAEVKKYFQEENKKLANIEESIITQVKKTIIDLRGKEKEFDQISDLIANIVTGIEKKEQTDQIS